MGSSSTSDANPHAGPSRNVSAESTTLRTYLRETEKKLFPRDGNIANCNLDDLKRQAAIFLVNRKALRESSPCLDSSTIYLAVDNFVKHLPFAHRHKDAGLKMRSYSMILAEALRALGQEADTMTHLERNSWYDGITKLQVMTQTLLKDSCPEKYQIETWDAIFHLKYSQNLLVCIEDIQRGGTAMLVEKGVLLMKGAIQGFNHQWELVSTIKDLLQRHRDKSEWHIKYLALESMAFLAAEFDPPEPSTNTYDAAYETVKQIKDYLEDALPVAKTTTFMGKAIAAGRRFSSQISQLTMSAGPSEIHPDYFVYGLLHLLYQLAFRVNDERCFSEMIGSVRVVLRTKKKIDYSLYRKAVDLYYAIDELGQLEEKRPKRTYGEDQDLHYIKDWIHKYPAWAENAQTSRAYSNHFDFLIFSDDFIKAVRRNNISGKRKKKFRRE